MNTKILLTVLFILSLASCKKDNFFDKFPPEIMYFQGTKVENANFTGITLPADSTTYLLKARVSAPFGLKEVKVVAARGNSQDLINTIADFGSSPNETFIYQQITNIKGNMEIIFTATGTDNRVTTKNFTITKN
ncbi:MAG: hypothetical protein J7539_12965 [Niabella sp.]|nr:hypothetical protein [Niabella sp.]